MVLERCCLLGAGYIVCIAVVGLAAQPRPAALAVVFGNTVTANGPSPRLRARLDAAVALYRRGIVTRILVSGGRESKELDEAAIMAVYLTHAAVPRTAIILDSAGVDTFETARHAAKLVSNDAGIVVVTQWFHIPRAILAMRRFGLTNVSGAWPRWFEPRDAYSLLREAVALPVYLVRPRGDPPPIGPQHPRP